MLCACFAVVDGVDNWLQGTSRPGSPKSRSDVQDDAQHAIQKVEAALKSLKSEIKDAKAAGDKAEVAALRAKKLLLHEQKIILLRQQNKQLLSVM